MIDISVNEVCSFIETELKADRFIHRNFVRQCETMRDLILDLKTNEQLSNPECLTLLSAIAYFILEPDQHQRVLLVINSYEEIISDAFRASFEIAALLGAQNDNHCLSQDSMLTSY